MYIDKHIHMYINKYTQTIKYKIFLFKKNILPDIIYSIILYNDD